jgi:succinoglycan biosynthesis protein ExoA
MKFISVIIPCRNERAFLARCLDSILASDYPTDCMEVILADGMSEDGTRELIAEYTARDGRVRMIDNPQRITPTALNRAIKSARGEYIGRVDAHAAIAPDYLWKCAHYLDSTDASNVGGAMQTLAQSSGPFAEAIIVGISHRFGVGNSYFRIGSDEPRWVDTVFGGFWRREVFERVGVFNENLTRSQDMEFSLRLKAAGGKTLLAPDVRSNYFARSDLASFWRHNFLNGQWAVLPFLYSDVIPVSFRHLIPLVFVAAVLMGVALLPWTPWLLAAVLRSYAAVNLMASVQVSVKTRRAWFAVQMPIVFAGLHLGYGLGSVLGLGKLAFRFAGRREPEECGSTPGIAAGRVLPYRNPRDSGASAARESGRG